MLERKRQAKYAALPSAGEIEEQIGLEDVSGDTETANESR
jgi:hypothetical protein